MVPGFHKKKRKSLVPFFLFVLTSLFIGFNTTAKTNVVVPSDDIIEHCVLAGCDNQLFYKFYYKNRARFSLTPKNLCQERIGLVFLTML